MLKKAQSWYAEGLKFQCTMCGNCCTGPSGEIPLLVKDSRKLAKHIGLSHREFQRRYTTISLYGRKRVLKMKPTPDNDGSSDCIFLDRNRIRGKAVCSVHSAKPLQCQAWPFWPSILESEETWKATGEHCPGINRGDQVLPLREVEAKRRLMRGPERKFGMFERGW